MLLSFVPTLLVIVFFGESQMFLVTVTFGFIVSIALKEVNNKNEYLFYYNNGVSKSQLWVVSFIMAQFFVLLFIVLFVIIKLFLK
jgi:hypothetical protein